MLIRTLFVSLSCFLMSGCGSSNHAGSAYSADELNEHWFKVNLRREGVIATDTGLQYKIIKESKGCKPDADFKISVHYKMMSANRKRLIDSSYQRGGPSQFELSDMIRGWRQGVPMMKVGETWELYIPPNLAYGSRASGDIPADSILISEVTLIDARCEK